MLLLTAFEGYDSKSAQEEGMQSVQLLEPPARGRMRLTIVIAE